MYKSINKILIFLFLFGISTVSTNAKDTYIFGGPKILYYDVDQGDVDKLATDLVNLGFSTAKVEVNTAGIGFDIGVGFPVADMIDIEASFAYLGEMELKANLTGPVENITATSSATTVPIVAKIKFGDDNAQFFVKGGWHFWSQESDITASLGTVKLWGEGNDPVVGFGAHVAGFDLSYEHFSFSGVGAGAGLGDGGIGSLSFTWSTTF